MFPTTVWTTIREAGDDDRQALERVAEGYRSPVLAFVRSRGIAAQDAEDLCQEVFVRLLGGRVLAKADAAKGRFRSLLLTVASRVIVDWRRKRTLLPVPDLDPPDTVEQDADFDRAWVLLLVERSLQHLKQKGSPYYHVLRGHLSGTPQDRNRLWIARKKLIALVRHEVALTCDTPEQIEEEIAHLTPFLRSAGKK